MSANTSIPVSPMHPLIAEPNGAFKKRAWLALYSIIAFLLVYILLFLLASGFAALCIYAGIGVILVSPGFMTVLLGLGLAGTGIMVFIFLIKFLFTTTSKHDRSALIEITETEQPRLFAVIRELAEQTNTQFPKKVFIVPDVNASVFYNSSFWSMFFPVRKNLQIGLGLVNSLNVSEFKAVLAHEFGHFSQRTMKLGSYVYNLNRIIYNLLFENTSYGNFINSWAKGGNIFALFAVLTVKIVQGIQWILRQMYGVVNKNYLQLSREMEFHADAIAASVCGSNNMITALRRVEVAHDCYNLALQKCDQLLKENKRSSNIYHAHRTVLKRCGEENNLLFQNDLPVITADFMAAFNLSRLNFKDPWASHPSLQERVDHLYDLNVHVPSSKEEAWVLFDDAEQLKEQLTKDIYEPVEAAKNALLIDQDSFAEHYNSDIAHFSFPKKYNGYYNNRQIEHLNMHELIGEKPELNFKQIFSKANAVLPKRIEALGNDIVLLNEIIAKNLDVNTFEFDGRKYHRREAPVVKQKLENELEATKLQLKQLDRQAILFFYQAARQKGQQDAEILKSSYVDYFEFQRSSDQFLNELNNMLHALRPIYTGQTLGLKEIDQIISTHKASGEKVFKSYLKKWLAMGAFYGNTKLKQRVEKFLNADYIYFSGNAFMNNELEELNNLATESWQAVNLFVFRKFKGILEMQLKLMPKEVAA